MSNWKIISKLTQIEINKYTALRKRHNKVLEVNKRYHDLLITHGVCLDCEQMYSHDIETPIANCGCGSSEWYNLTPYMKMEQKLYELQPHPLKGKVSHMEEYWLVYLLSVGIGLCLLVLFDLLK